MKGRSADLKGSENEVSDLKAIRLKPWKFRLLKTAKTLPQKVEGTRALRGKIPT